MKELIAPLLKALKDEWYPDPADGQPRKVKVSGTGIALLGVVLLMVQVYYLRSDVGEVKQQVGLIWQVMVTGKVPPAAVPNAGPSLIGSATADELPGESKR